MSAGFERFTRAIARRPLQALLIVAVLAIGGAVLALRLKPSTGIGTFVGSGSSSYQSTLDDEHHFGSDAVVVLIREPLTDLVETKDLGTLSFLEACLAGKVVQRNLQLGAYTEVPGQAPYGGWGSPCGRLMRSQPVKAVYGPATFLNHAVVAINQTIGTMTHSAQLSSQRQSTTPMSSRSASTRVAGRPNSSRRPPAAWPSSKNSSRRRRSRTSLGLLRSLGSTTSSSSHRWCSMPRAVLTSPRRGSPISSQRRARR